MHEEEFVERAQRLRLRLYRTAFLYTGSESVALDVLDEAIYRGFQARKALRQPEYFDTWLTRILINECKKELRRRKREHLVEALPETAVEVFDALPLRDAVLRLPQALKDVIVLRYFAGYTLAETAQSLALPQGTVVTRQRRALAILKLELSEEV